MREILYETDKYWIGRGWRTIQDEYSTGHEQSHGVPTITSSIYPMLRTLARSRLEQWIAEPP